MASVTLVDNAIYPTLFMAYVTSVAGWDSGDFGGWARFGSTSLLTICLALLNYRGLAIVGNSTILVCILAISPFLVFIVMGAPKVDPSRWLKMPEVPQNGTELFDDDLMMSAGPLPLLGLGGVVWRPYLNNLFWNLNSFDSVGSFSGETASASTIFPRGMFIGVLAIVLGYLIPLLVAVGATESNQADWVDGYLAVVAGEIGGKWLATWIVFAAGISNLALFEAEMSSDSFLLMGMGKLSYSFLPMNDCTFS